VTSESETQHAVGELLRLGVLAESSDGTLQRTERGRGLFASVSKSIERITSTLSGDLPQADLEAAHRVLLEVANRANKLLALE
jgi:hypothetical protein